MWLQRPNVEIHDVVCNHLNLTMTAMMAMLKMMMMMIMTMTTSTTTTTTTMMMMMITSIAQNSVELIRKSSGLELFEVHSRSNY